MNLRNIAYRKAHDIFFRLKGYQSPQIWKFLEESQYHSAKEIKNFQDRSLQKLIEYSYKNVIYYRRVMDERGLKPENIEKTDDLVKLPVLTKKQLRDNWNELISVDASSLKASPQKTGGSTGEPIRIMNDYLNSAWEGAAFRRGLGFAGYKLGVRRIDLLGGTLGLRPESFREKITSQFSGRMFLPAFEIGRDTLEFYIRKIRQSKARYLIGYTSAIHLLAKLMEDAKLNIALKAVFPTAENLYNFQRETIKKSFQCEVFDMYGCGECNSIAFECSLHNGLHVSDEHVFIEALKGNERVLNGKMGALTLTKLHSYAMPLIRYQNDDVISLSSEMCSCGRSLCLISEIYGRTNDLLLAQDGKLVSGSFVPHLFRNTEGIEQVQVLQEKRDIIHLKIVKTSKFVNGELGPVIEVFRRYLGDLKINIEYVASIPKTPQGKMKFVISRFGDKLLK